MPRVCSREGCGQPLLRKDGTPDFHRHFCGTACKNADKREKIQAKRAQTRKGKCSLCGRRPQSLALDGDVPRHAAVLEDITMIRDKQVRDRSCPRARSAHTIQRQPAGITPKLFQCARFFPPSPPLSFVPTSKISNRRGAHAIAAPVAGPER